MSTTTTPPQLEQVRERVLQIARDIEELAQSDRAPETFFPEFLRLLVGAVGAAAGAVWLRGRDRGIELAAEVGLKQAGLRDDPQALRRNEPLLAEVLSNGQSCAFAPDDGRDVALPTAHCLILGALQEGSDCVGVVEVFHRPDAPRQARPGYLQFVEQMCGFASRYLEGRRAQQNGAAAAAPTGDLEGFADFVLQLQRSLKIRDVAAAASNDGRLYLNCDRLSVALRRGRKTKVLAISGQDSVNPRANLVRSMAALASSVVAVGEPLTYTGQTEDLPPQLEKPLGDYLQESGSRMVLALPLFETEPPRRREERDRPQTERRTRAFACLVVEQISESRPRPGLLERTDLAADHVAASLFNARSQQRVFLLPLWRALGRGLEWFHGRKLLKTAAVLALLAAVGLTLALVPWDYRVNGEGRLMPVVQREVFAPLDGEVEQVYVEGGQRVLQGQPLVQLRNDELRRDLLAAENELREKQKLAYALEAQIDDAVRNAERDRVIEMQARLVETQIEIAGVEEEVKVLKERRSQLTVPAPLDGVVATFQVKQLLQDRPVMRGEVLLEVMDDTRDWRLELEVEEHRLGHMLRALEPSSGSEDAAAGLPLEFILATIPEKTYAGRLESIATRTSTSEEQGSIIEVLAAINAHDLPRTERRIGAEVRAKINCGRRSLGYVLFGDVVEFVQKYFWL